MDHTLITIKIIEMAKVGGALPPQEAIAQLAAMIDKLEMWKDSYERDLEMLLKIGATIWDLSSGPEGAHDPGWIPPRLRP